MCIQFLLQDVGVAALAIQDWCSQPWSIAALQALPAHRSQRGRQNRQSPRSPLGRKAASRERERERGPNLVERAPYLFLHLFLPSPVGLGIPQQEQGDHLASEKKVQEDPAQYCAFWSSSKMISFTYVFICWACVSRRLDFRADSWPLEWNSNKEHKSGDGKRRQTRSRRVRSRGFDHAAVSAVILQANISEQCHCRCQVGDDHLPGGFFGIHNERTTRWDSCEVQAKTKCVSKSAADLEVMAVPWMCHVLWMCLSLCICSHFFRIYSGSANLIIAGVHAVDAWLRSRLCRRNSRSVVLCFFWHFQDLRRSVLPLPTTLANHSIPDLAISHPSLPTTISMYQEHCNV